MWRVPLRKLWKNLPYDGQGLFPPAHSVFAELRRRAASRFWKRTPWWTRPLLIPLARLGWVAACVSHVWKYGRAEKLPLRLAPRLTLDCLRSGARPNEALIWRQFFPASGAHPLPGRAAGRFLSQLGSAAEHCVLADKQSTAELLANRGLPVPPTLEILLRGRTIDLGGPVWTRPGHLFVKARHGWAGWGAMAVDVLAPGVYRIDGGPALGSASLRNRLAAASSDDLLVQTRLQAAPELADLATSGAPVLRLTTARNPGEAPFLYSGLISINAPGEWPRNFIRGQIRAPIDPSAGCMGSGIWFLHPGERYLRLPWNHALLAGRLLPRMDVAVEVVLQAMTLFPALPLVNWDLIVTCSGPVILEGNTCGDWILTNLSTVEGVETAPLAALLSQWAQMRDNTPDAFFGYNGHRSGSGEVVPGRSHVI